MNVKLSTSLANFSSNYLLDSAESSSTSKGLQRQEEGVAYD